MGEFKLNNEQKNIKKYLEEREIKELVHFTDSSNIESIIKNGILSRKELEEKEIEYKCNDDYRYDNKLDYVSLSITKTNTYLQKAFCRNKKIENLAIIHIDASILYEEINIDRLYCDRNAANSVVNKGDNLQDLKNMFVDELIYSNCSSEYNYNRNNDGRKLNETTDIQAEILIKKVDPRYIKNIEYK